MNDREDTARCRVAFNQSTTGKGEGYAVSATNEATEDDVRRAHNMAALGRELAIDTLAKEKGNAE